METPGEDSGFGYEDPSNPVEEGSENVSVSFMIFLSIL